MCQSGCGCGIELHQDAATIVRSRAKPHSAAIEIPLVTWLSSPYTVEFRTREALPGTLWNERRMSPRCVSLFSSLRCFKGVFYPRTEYNKRSRNIVVLATVVNSLRTKSQRHYLTSPGLRRVIYDTEKSGSPMPNY